MRYLVFTFGVTTTLLIAAMFALTGMPLFLLLTCLNAGLTIYVTLIPRPSDPRKHNVQVDGECVDCDPSCV